MLDSAFSKELQPATSINNWRRNGYFRGSSMKFLLKHIRATLWLHPSFALNTIDVVTKPIKPCESLFKISHAVFFIKIVTYELNLSLTNIMGRLIKTGIIHYTRHEEHEQNGSNSLSVLFWKSVMRGKTQPTFHKSRKKKRISLLLKFLILTTYRLF